MEEYKEELVRDGYYHLYNHAAQGVKLFLDEEDYNFYLGKLNTAIEGSRLKLCCWCLVEDQFHFLIQQKGKVPADEIFNELNAKYATYYMHRYKKMGKVFRTGLQFEKIEGEDNLLQLCLNIHIKTGAVGIGAKTQSRGFSDYWVWVLDNELQMRDEMFNLSKEEYRELVKDYSRHPEKLKKMSIND
ncbi:MAG: hypothetical protein K9N06_07045 [Candidatus Cloacimonetes bacterium]|nr:hypothetical protein [Candidatus Cloacimonadota bacterium]